MRILHVTDVYRPRVGGIELFVEELAERQAQAGHDVTVLTQTAGPAGVPAGRAVTVMRSPFSGIVPSGAPFDARPAYSTYDVVHAHLSVASPFATRAAQSAVARGVPTVNTVHSIWTGREAWVRLVGTLAGWRTWPTVWTGVSTVAAREMAGGLPPGVPVMVVPNAVDVAWWRQQPRLPVPRRSLTLVSVMRLAGRKRPMQLLDMVAEVATLVPEVPWRVLIVGAGPLESRILRARRALDIVDRVQLTGQLTRNEVREVYRRADVYVAPSFRESFGIAPLEARSAGLAVVAMRSGGVGEFVRHGVEGLLCDDDADMVRALALLAAEPVVLDRLTTYNRVHRPTLDWGVTLEGYEAAYVRAAQLAGRLLPRR